MEVTTTIIPATLLQPSSLDPSSCRHQSNYYYYVLGSTVLFCQVDLQLPDGETTAFIILYSSIRGEFSSAK